MRYQIELFSPRFTVYVELTKSVLEQVRAGQTATISTRGNRVTLSRIIGQHLTQWLASKGSGPLEL